MVLQEAFSHDARGDERDEGPRSVSATNQESDQEEGLVAASADSARGGKHHEGSPEVSRLYGGVRVLKHGSWRGARPKVLRVTSDLTEVFYTAIGR